MKLKNLLNIHSENRIAVLLPAAFIYLLLGTVVYLFSFGSIHTRSISSIKMDMQDRLSAVAGKINADLERKFINTKNMSTDNTVVRAVKYDAVYQFSTYCDKKSKEYGLRRLVITYSDGRVVYASGLSGRNIDYNIASSEYTSYFKTDRVYLQFYFPLLDDENRLCGSISSLYDSGDYRSTLENEAVKDRFILFTVFDGGITDFYPRIENKQGRSPQFKYIFLKRISDQTQTGENLISVSTDEISNSFEQNGIALGLTLEAYNSIKLRNVWFAAFLTLSVLLILTLIVIFILIFIQRYIFPKAKLENEIKSLRMQRHDFIRHVDIVSSLAVSNNTEELKKYVSSLSIEVSVKNALNMLGNMAVSALLGSRERIAAEKNIRFELLVKTSIEGLKMKDSELCTIIGNLLDNAIEASLRYEGGMRYIEVEFSRSDGNYVIRVTNAGDTIKAKNIDRIFDYGYSTKEDKTEHGVGLYTVSQIVQSHNGFIKVWNVPGRVSFEIYLPR